MHSQSIWLKIKRERGLYQYRSSGQFYARVRFRGKLYRQKLNTNDLALARRKLREFRNDLERTDATRGNTSFAKLLDDYKATLTGAEATIRDKARLIAKLKATFPGVASRPLRHLQPSAFESWLVSHYGQFTASAYNSALTLLRDALSLAVRDRIIPENPVSELKYRKRAKPIRLTPSFEQFQAIVSDIRAQQFNADSEASGDFIEGMGLLGLGQAELSGIQRAHVDLSRGEIKAFRKKTGTEFTVPIFPQARALIERLCDGKAHGDRLFLIDNARKGLGNACSRLGYPNFTQRSLRRMFISRAIEFGVDVKVLAQWQAHTDGGKLILDTYSHVRAPHASRMAALMTSEQPENVVRIRSGAP